MLNFHLLCLTEYTGIDFNQTNKNALLQTLPILLFTIAIVYYEIAEDPTIIFTKQSSEKVIMLLQRRALCSKFQNFKILLEKQKGIFLLK